MKRKTLFLLDDGLDEQSAREEIEALIKEKGRQEVLRKIEKDLVLRRRLQEIWFQVVDKHVKA